jgi:DNA ligase-1
MSEFAELARLAEEMAGTSSRLAKRAAIAEAIGRVHAEGPETEDAGLFAMYLAGLPFAEADPRKLNAGGALLSKAVLAVSGASGVELTAAYRRHGDLGAATFDLLAGGPIDRDETAMNGARASSLTLEEVRLAFAGMAAAKTTAIRAGLVEGLLRRASALEAKYLLKLMLGDMRIGVKQSLVEEGIAVAAGVDVVAVRHAVMLEADLAGATARAFAGTLGEARMRLFHPLGFMLASPVETPEEAVARFTAKPVKGVAPKGGKREKGRGKRGDDEVEDLEVLAASPMSENPDVGHPISGVQAFLEDKYDGMRAQIHCGAGVEYGGQAGRVAIYSRNREDITEGFPELVEAFAEVGEGEGGLIFDGEILGWDFAAGQALPFAVLGQRIGRKRVGNDMRVRIPVVFMAFDLMFAGGELLLPLPLRERRNRLEAVVERLVERTVSPLALSEAAARRQLAQASMFGGDEEPDGGVARLMISPSRLVETAEEIDRAYAEARARANEGVMLKAAGSAYLPGRRGLAWVKLKRELATLDVVVTGAEFGHGKRAGLLSDYTFAVRGKGGELLNVGKAYSGVTDAEIAELTEFFQAHTVEEFGHFRTVEPLMIFEVAFNNIMRSDRHASGFALRFPRILRIRNDKPLSEIDTVTRVEEIYQSQVDKPVEQG